jgi:hypothetical protein
LTFGKVVEVSISPDGATVSIGGKEYPAASVALKKNGCFEVGIEQGIGEGVFSSPTFSGTGRHEGRSVTFDSDISVKISASVEICPTLKSAIQLTADPTSTKKKEHPQRMLAVSVDPPARSSGGKLKATLDAYCLDFGRDTPEDHIRFKINPSMKINVGALANAMPLASGSDDDRDIFQHCVWAAFPDEYWKVNAAGLLEVGFYVGADGGLHRFVRKDGSVDVASLETALRSSLADDEQEFGSRCLLSSRGLSGSFTIQELRVFAKCFKKSGGSKEQCIYGG